MPGPVASLAPASQHPSEDREAFAVLLAEVEGSTGRIPAALVAKHLLRVTAGGDLSLRQAALDALLRRIKAAEEASRAWRIEGARRGRPVVGPLRLSVGRGKSYGLLVCSYAELEGTCGCADFARSSLGLCKHLWWVLQKGFRAKGAARGGSSARPALWWDPMRPLTGPGDWLEGLRWTLADVPPELKGWFAPRGSPRPLKSAFAAAPEQRLKVVRALLAWADGGSRAEVRCDPALSGLLQREVEHLTRRLQGAPSPRELKGALARLRRPLFPYQQEGVARFLAAGRLLLADDMGLGKTAQAIASCHVLHATGRVRRGLVIVPAALKTQWLREWRLFTTAPAAVVEGPPEARARQYRGLKSGFLLVNYEQVLKDLPELVRLAPELVVLDEAQRIKNWAAKTSLYVKQLQPAWRLVLSGTPLENRLTELASLMDWVDDLALEPKWRLGEWHAVRADGAREVVGAKNLDTLRARLAPCSLRRVRKEVLSQLPPRTDNHVPVALTDEQAEAHAELDQPIAQLLQMARRRPLTQAQFLRLMSLMTQQRIICNGLAQRDFEETWPALQRSQRPSETTLRGLFSPKLLELRELLSNLVVTQGRKVVVFSQWKRMLRLAEWAVSDLLADAGHRAVFFTGEESQKRRTQNVVEFHDDPRTRVFFATDAGGVGLNLQHAASACVHLDLPWNPAVLEQRSGRIYRFGQKSPVEVYALVAASGIESRIASIVGDKKALFDGLFDGSSDEVRFEKGGSFMATLQRVLAPAPVPELPAGAEEEEPEPSGDVSDTTAAAPGPAPAPGAMQAPGLDFMAGIRVQRMEDGRLILEAKPEAAAGFAAMLEGLAALLRQVAPAAQPVGVEQGPKPRG